MLGLKIVVFSQERFIVGRIQKVQMVLLYGRLTFLITLIGEQEAVLNLQCYGFRDKWPRCPLIFYNRKTIECLGPTFLIFTI